ncbi:TIR domain-containing protein, partial [Promicromonospora kroppenstedtii]|uniref:TIR domain-containing protein n=1 Tax=Promicromonospora kroppenstedtii TaxID=440482 RepID=UPI0005639AAB
MTDRIVRSLLPTSRAGRVARNSRAHAAPPSGGYDAFLSYSRDSDGEFAPAFHAELLDFDKRDDVPDLNVFLDRTGLANNPSLWDAIERKLERSDYLILFASEGAASSKYVAKEVAWWLDHRGPETLLVALTSGKIVWDQTANEIDAISTTALPAPLVERIDHEPKWTDLTRLRQRRFWRHHPDRPGVLAELVAPLRGADVSTEEILSAHIARQSSAGLRNRLVNMALAVMLVLSIGAFAYAQREADRANEAVNANEAHLLGATSHVVHQDDPATAQLLAVEAVRRLRDGQTRTALFNAVTANEPADPYLLRTVDVPEETGLADVAPTAAGVVGRTETGDLVRWNPDDGAPTVLRGDRTPFGSVTGSGRAGPVV